MARFLREARILSNIQHAGIVSVIDFGKEEGDRPAFWVVPDTDNGSFFYAGAKWQIDF